MPDERPQYPWELTPDEIRAVHKELYKNVTYPGKPDINLCKRIGIEALYKLIHHISNLKEEKPDATAREDT